MRQIAVRRHRVNAMTIMVMDAQGGGIGRQVVSAIRDRIPDAEILAVGTNSAATAAMVKAGADHGATGENAATVCSRRADFIVGPIGIVIADAMYGEITPAIAEAVGKSRAQRVLIPMRNCGNTVAGVANYQISSLIREAVDVISQNRESNKTT
jgi:hypothetical protein